MRKLIVLSLTSIALVQGCERPEKPFVSKGHRTLLTGDLAVQDVTRVPTNPIGGLVKGKLEGHNPEEDLRRETFLSNEPIVFGTSVAGISMTTKRQDSKAILPSPRFSTDSGIDLFGGNLQITWDSGTNPVPASIIITEDYRGALVLPAPYFAMRMKEESSLLAADPDRTAFTRASAAFFADQSPGYDCLAEGTCLIEKRGTVTYIDYPKGTLALIGNSLALVAFYPNGSLSPANASPIVAGVSLGGLTLATTKVEAAAKLGAPNRFSDPKLSLYDAKTVRVSWNDKNLPAFIMATPGYRGKIRLGETERLVGSDFADLTTRDDVDGLALRKRLGQLILGRDSSYDCALALPIDPSPEMQPAPLGTPSEDPTAPSATLPPVPTCYSEHVTERKTLSIQVLNTIFEFSDDEKRTLLSVSIYNTAA